MTAVTFATHAFITKLCDAGFEEKQAVALSDALKKTQEVRQDELVSRGDLQLETEKVRREIETVRLDMKEQELRLIKWVVGSALASVGVIVTAVFAIIRILG